MDSVYLKTDGMQGYLYTNGDLLDGVNWDDLQDIQWITTNITDISIEELSRRMKIVAERSNVIGQTIVATLDDYNLERVLDISRFGLENGYRLRFHRNLYRGLDADYKQRLLKKCHELCDLLESYVARGFDVHTTFLFDTLIPLWSFDSSPYPCGRRVVAVFPDGSIGPCLRNHVYKAGTIFDPNPLRSIQCDTFLYSLAKDGLPAECQTCESRTVCQGGCPYDKLLLTGSTTGKSVACEIHKEIIPRLRRLEEAKSKRGGKPQAKPATGATSTGQ